jgi:hypothetical protein
MMTTVMMTTVMIAAVVTRTVIATAVQSRGIKFRQLCLDRQHQMHRGSQNCLHPKRMLNSKICSKI